MHELRKISSLQIDLPKNPNIKDLPFISGDLFRKCPNLVYCIWKSGRHAAMRLTCKSWNCPNCSEDKINEMSQIVADATSHQSLVHEIESTMKYHDNITRYLRRKKISALSIKLTNGLYILTSDMATGKGWGSQAISRAAAIAKIHTIDKTRIKRRDFTQDWRPEATYEPKRDTVVYSTTFSDMDDLQDVLDEYGLDIRNEFVEGEVIEVMERITKGRLDQTITFENVEYKSI